CWSLLLLRAVLAPLVLYALSLHDALPIYGDADDVLAPDRVGGDRRGERGVDAARAAEDDGPEAVLAHVPGEARDARAVDLLVGVQLGRARAARRTVGRQVPHEQVLDELRGGRDDGARRVGDERAAVEHEVVLAADEVDVRDGRAHLARAPRGEVGADVALALLVRGAVEHEQQVEPVPRLVERRHLGDRAALLPDVLADRDAHAAALDLDDRGGLAGREDAELVEHAVVRQVVLVVRGLHHAVAQHDRAVRREVRGRARRLALGGARAARGARRPDRAQHDRDPAQPPGAEARRDVRGGVPRRATERRAQGEVLDRVPGEGHLGERDELRARRRRLAGALEDERGVAVEVPHARVDLCQRDAQISHASTLDERRARLVRGGVAARDVRHTTVSPVRHTDQAGCTAWTGSRSSCSAR